MKWQGIAYREWFKAQEPALHQQAAVAGLLQHSSTVGSAREFFVKTFLRSILPPIVHIGSGVIVDAHNLRSKQIDIVLYDPRFPLMEIEAGVGMYLMEGVIATIEVKTTLSTAELRVALDNCFSVHKLNLVTPNSDALRRRVDAIQQEFRKSRLEACIQAGCETFPATYIFGFGGLGAESLCDAVSDWFQENRASVELDAAAADGPIGIIPALPRIIVAGDAVGTANDQWVTVAVDAQDLATIQSECGPEGRLMMLFSKTDCPFWWFGTHLLHTVCARMGMVHATSGVGFSPDQYIATPMVTMPSYFFASPIPAPRGERSGSGTPS